MNDHSDTDDTNGDGEGVWSPDIEQCFREALLLFPPCGRRKHILQEEGGGKMYGRNELIARHIMMRTGKVRTRKQVSSHIQVLARRKAKAEAATGGGSGPAGSSSPASSMNASIGPGATSRLTRPDSTSSHHQLTSELHGHQQLQATSFYDVWNDRPVVTQKIRLVEFSAFIEYRQASLQPTSIGGFDNQTAQATDLASLATAAANSADLPSDQPSSQTQNGGCSVHVSPTFGLPATISSLPQQHPSPHPLASNHHLSAQFNQATNYQPLNNNNHQHHQNQGTDLIVTSTAPSNGSHMQLQPQLHSSTGFTRHSYVKIDYRQPIGAQTNKLERIDISQIQDKFPEIGGSEGLFQRGPSDAFFLVKFWADLNNDYEYNIEDQNSYFGFSSHFETIDPYKDITCSTKACSYGLQVVEKVEKIYGAFNNLNGRYSYDINRSPMCEFMIQFIKKLRQLPRASQMNSVLENFTVLQVITSESTSEILLCLAYVFEIASPEQHKGSQYHVYKLTQD